MHYGVKPLRIIVVLMDPPLPFGKAAARWYYVLLRELVARGHEVTAFIGCEGADEIAATEELLPRPRYDLRYYPVRRGGGLAAKLASIRRPYSYLFRDGFRRDLGRELASGFDVLHLEQLWSGWAGRGYEHKSLLNVHYSLAVDQEGYTPASLRDRLLWRRAYQAERYLLQRYPRIRTLTPRLSALARKANPDAEIHTVPLGIDASLYPFLCSPRANGVPPTIGLVGSFNWIPSQRAGHRLLTRLWPAIQQAMPAARLMMIGHAARSVFREYTDWPGVTILEDVPDIVPYFTQLDVLLYAPPRGTGMKVKILEAFALGVPVVTNSEGAEGLPIQDGFNAALAEDDKGLVERAIHLLRNSDRGRAQALAARQVLQYYCAPASVTEAVERLYHRIAEARPVQRKMHAFAPRIIPPVASNARPQCG